MDDTKDFIRRAEYALHDMQGRVDAGKLEMFSQAIDRLEALAAKRDRFAERHVRHLVLGAEIRARAEAAEAKLEACTTENKDIARSRDDWRRVCYALQQDMAAEIAALRKRAEAAELDAARAEGFAEAREMAAQVCATHGVLGGPTPNPYACWKVHADNIAAAIRTLQPKENPHD